MRRWAWTVIGIGVLMCTGALALVAPLARAASPRLVSQAGAMAPDKLACGPVWQVLADPSVGPNDLSPPGPSSGSNIQGIAARASDDVWAIGHTKSSANGPGTSLVEHWEGRQWAVVPDPHSSLVGSLNAIAVAGPHDVWVAGTIQSGQDEEAYLARWTGQDWQVANLPPFQGTRSLWALTASAADDVWALGSQDAPPLDNGLPDPMGESYLILHWDGHSWQTMPLPLIGDDGRLHAIFSLDPHNVWIVGEADHIDQAIVDHWDGTQWNAVGDLSDFLVISLETVAARSPTDLWTADL